MDRLQLSVRGEAANRLPVPGDWKGTAMVQFGALRFQAMRAGGSTPGTSTMTVNYERQGLVVPAGLQLHATPAQPGVIHIGPLIGLFSAGHVGAKRGRANQPFAAHTYLFRHLIEAASRMRALAFAFEPGSIDWGSQRIRGMTWRHGHWVPVVVPFPDVVYNRVPNRRLENLGGVQKTLEGLKRAGVLVFNPRFIDKSRLYDCLTRDALVSNYLPETKPLASLGDVTAALRRFPLVYLKPRFGSLGHGIIRLERAELGQVRVRYRSTRGNQTRVVRPDQLAGALRVVMRGREYVVQQGIDLPLFIGRPFDVRILTQKDGRGVWRLTGMGVRVAGAGCITTHVPAGGSIANIDRVLLAVYGEHAPLVQNSLRTAIAAIAPAIERGLGQSYGEFSMDLGLDPQGNVWFFEANSKPHKFDEDSIRSLSWVRTIQYAAFLGGFTELGG